MGVLYIYIKYLTNFKMSSTKFTYTPKGVCCRQIEFSFDENGAIESVLFIGGCNGNLQGISSLVKGMQPNDVIAKLKGINCNGKGTSCPDQFAKALSNSKAE